MTLNLLIITTALLSLCLTALTISQQRTTQHPVTERSSDILFGDPFDIWRLVKVPEREAAQVIRRASRLHYKEIQHLWDKAGSVYILFQLCPPRKIGNAVT